MPKLTYTMPVAKAKRHTPKPNVDVNKVYAKLPLNLNQTQYIYKGGVQSLEGSIGDISVEEKQEPEEKLKLIKHL